jgi:hypothetical protein
LIGDDGTLSGFVTGVKDEHSFAFCTRSVNVSGEEHQSSWKKSEVVVQLRKPTPPLRIQYIRDLQLSRTLDFPSMTVTDDPNFNQRYHVSGPDGDAVRNAFTPALRAAVVSGSFSLLVTNGDSILGRWESSIGWPSQIEPLLEHAVTIAEMLEQAPSAGALPEHAPHVIPPSPIRRRHPAAAFLGFGLGTVGICAVIAGIIFAIAAYLAGALDTSASRGLVGLFAGSVAGIVIGLLLVFAGRHIWVQDRPFLKRSKTADPLEKAARRSARMLTSWRRRNPDQPIGSAIDSQVAILLQKFAPEAPRSAALNAILNGGAVADIHELCRALVELQTGISPQDAEAYARLTRAVDQELAAAL